MTVPPKPSRGAAFAILASTVTSAALLLAACGGDDAEPTPTATATPTATPEATLEPTPEVRWPTVAEATVRTDDLNVRVGPGTQHAVLGRLNNGDRVPVSGRSTEGRWLGLPGIGWVAYSDEWLELDVEPRSLPAIALDEAGFEFVGPLHEPDVSTDLPVVDQVVAAIILGDRVSLLGLVRRPAEGGPETAAKPREICADSVLPATELEAHVDAFLTSETPNAGPLRLYAVIGAPGEAGVRDPEFSVIFAFEGGEGRQLWINGRGEGIEWFSLGCGPTPPGTMLQQGGGETFFWFRPVTPDPLEPVL